MKENNFTQTLKTITSNKSYQMLFAILLSLFIIYGSYSMAIKEIIMNRKAIENRIHTTNVQEVEKSIKKLKKKRTTLVKEYRGIKKEFKGLEGKIFQEYYPIIQGILTQINHYAFNIHNYKLQNDNKKMDITIEGSYQNLIRLLDYLGTLPATLVVSQYKIILSKEQRLLISLTIEVETIRI